MVRQGAADDAPSVGSTVSMKKKLGRQATMPAGASRRLVITDEDVSRRRFSASNPNAKPDAEFQRELDAIEALPQAYRSYASRPEYDGSQGIAIAPLDGWGDIGSVTQTLNDVTSHIHEKLLEAGPMEIIHGSSPYVSCPDIRSTTHHLEEWDTEADRASWYDDFHRRTRPDVLHMAHSARGLDASMIDYEHLLDPQLMERGEEIDAHQHVRNAATAVLSSLDHLSPAHEGGRSEPGPGHQLHTQLRTAAAGVFEKLQDKPPPPEEPPFALPEDAGKNEGSSTRFVKDQDNGINAYHDAHHNVRNVAAEVIANLNIMVTEPKLEAVAQEMALRKKVGESASFAQPRASQAPRLSSMAQGGSIMRKSGQVRSTQVKPHGSVSKSAPNAHHHSTVASARPSATKAGPAAQQVGGGRSNRGSRSQMTLSTILERASLDAGPGARMIGGGGEGEHGPMPPMSDVEEGEEGEEGTDPLPEDVDGLLQESDDSNHLWPEGVSRDNFGDTFLQSALMQMSAVYKVAKEDISKRAAAQRDHRKKAECLRNEANVLRNRADDYWGQIQEYRRQLKAMYPALKLDYSEVGPPKVFTESSSVPNSNPASPGFGGSGALPSGVSALAAASSATRASPRSAKGASSLARPSAVASFALQQLGGAGSRRGSANSSIAEGYGSGTPKAKQAMPPRSGGTNKTTTTSSKSMKTTLQKNTLLGGSLLHKKKNEEPRLLAVGPPVRQKGNDDIERLLPYEEEFPLRALSEGSALSTTPSWSSLASWRDPSAANSPKTPQMERHGTNAEAIPLAPPESTSGAASCWLMRDSFGASLASSGALSEVSAPTSPPLAPEESSPAEYETVRLVQEPLNVLEEMVRCVNAVGQRRSHCTHEAHEVMAHDAGLTNAISSLLATTDMRGAACDKNTPELEEFDF